MCQLRKSCLTEAEVDILKIACEKVYRPGHKNSTYIMCTDSRPINVIEGYVLQLLHLQPQCACAEWWVQIRDENDPLIFHFDNDDNGDYPQLTAVTYLSDSNTCTAITSLMYSTRWCTRDKVIESTTLIKPQRGNVACFDGKHLHSTLSGNHSSIQPRITLMAAFYKQMKQSHNICKYIDRKHVVLKWPVATSLKVASPNHLLNRHYKSVGSDDYTVTLEIPTAYDHIILRPGGKLLVEHQKK